MFQQVGDPSSLLSNKDHVGMKKYILRGVTALDL